MFFRKDKASDAFEPIKIDYRDGLIGFDNNQAVLAKVFLSRCFPLWCPHFLRCRSKMPNAKTRFKMATIYLSVSLGYFFRF